MTNKPTDPQLPHAPAAPPAQRGSTVEVLHGVEVADPYRHLEEPDADVTKAFVDAQNAVSEPYLAALPAADDFRNRVMALLTGARAGVPWERGGRYFRLENPGNLDQDRLLTADSLEELLDSPTILLDPNGLSADGTVALVDSDVSPDGLLVAVALAEAGSDWRSFRVLSTATGQELPDRLDWAKWLGASWVPDASGFLYWRYPQLAGQDLVDEMPAGALVLHRLGTAQDDDVVVWEAPAKVADADWIAIPRFSGDGGWLMIEASPGTNSHSVIEVRRVDPASGALGPSIVVDDELTAAHHPVDIVDDVLLLHTEAGAPKGRVVTVDLGAPTSPWTELVAEHDTDVLVSATTFAGGLVLVRSRDTAHLVQIVDREARPLGQLGLGAQASVTQVQAKGDSGEVFVGSTSFDRRLLVQRVDVASGEPVVTEIAAGGGGSGPAIVSERRSATSADGTAVPMTVVRRADLTAGPAPTLLYGYGGFDICLSPTFSAMFAAWVHAGGVFVVANLRGGGEFGPAWHEAGMREHKQRVFDDLYGCAEELITSGTTTREQLAVHGRSNGGLLAGAAITQRPDLWAAALPTVGVMDMLRFHRFTIGKAWCSEFGNPDDAADFAVLHQYSPLHRIVDGTVYPATLICTGDHDDRVVPAHSLKFGAQLQHSQGGTAPILLRVDTRAGHGIGKPVRALAAEYADQLAFAAAHTGLRPMVS